MSKLNIGTRADGGAMLLPADMGDRKLALLAMSKAGKTYGLGDILEELYLAQRPFVAIDPANNLWGLRVKPDGTPSGFDVVVIGGDHADIPLERDAGDRIAEALLADPICAVVDVAFESKTVTRKFVTDFCNRLMRTRAAPERVIVLEEAPEFVPQSASYAGIQVCKAAVDRIIRVGGNFGYGAIVASQRSATIDKDILSQCEGLIVMRLTDKRDRKAIKDWIDAKNIDDQVRECFDGLADLKDGEAWLWWPVEERFERFQFRKRQTLHPREMKKLGLKPAAVELGDARRFVEKVKRELARTVVAVPTPSRLLQAAQDITELAKNPKLKRVLQQANAGVANALAGAQDRVKEHQDQVALLALENGKLKAENERQRRENSALHHEVTNANRRLAAVRAHLKPDYDALAALFEDLGEASPAGGQDLGEAWAPWMEKAAKVGARRFLEVLVTRGRLTQVQLATLAGLSMKGGHWRKCRAFVTRNRLATLQGEEIEAVRL